MGIYESEHDFKKESLKQKAPIKAGKGGMGIVKNAKVQKNEKILEKSIDN